MNRRFFLLGLAALPLVPSVQPEPPPIETLDDWFNQIVQYASSLKGDVTILSADNPLASTVGWLVCTGEHQSELFELGLRDVKALFGRTQNPDLLRRIRYSGGRRDIAADLTVAAGRKRIQRYGTLV